MMSRKYCTVGTICLNSKYNVCKCYIASVVYDKIDCYLFIFFCVSITVLTMRQISGAVLCHSLYGLTLL